VRDRPQLSKTSFDDGYIYISKRYFRSSDDVAGRAFSDGGRLTCPMYDAKVLSLAYVRLCLCEFVYPRARTSVHTYVYTCICETVVAVVRCTPQGTPFFLVFYFLFFSIRPELTFTIEKSPGYFCNVYIYASTDKVSSGFCKEARAINDPSSRLEVARVCTF